MKVDMVKRDVPVCVTQGLPELLKTAVSNVGGIPPEEETSDGEAM